MNSLTSLNIKRFEDLHTEAIELFTSCKQDSNSFLIRIFQIAYRCLYYPVDCWKQNQFIRKLEKQVKDLNSIPDNSQLKILQNIQLLIRENKRFFVFQNAKICQQINLMMASLPLHPQAVAIPDTPIPPTVKPYESPKVELMPFHPPEVSLQQSTTSETQENEELVSAVSVTAVENQHNNVVHFSEALVLLSQATPLNAKDLIANNEVIRSLPQKNPVRSGYQKVQDYTTVLGDNLIAKEIGLGLLSVLSVSLFKLIGCVSDSEIESEVAVGQCYAQVDAWWHQTIPITCIVAGGILLSGTIFLHRTGWLGAYLHDPGKKKRLVQLNRYYNEMATELVRTGKFVRDENNSDKILVVQKMARKILTKIPVINFTLHTDLQLTTQESKKITNSMVWACKEVLA